MPSSNGTSDRRGDYWRLVRRERPNVTSEGMSAFMSGLDDALARYRAAVLSTSTYRDAHEALRDLYLLLQDLEPDLVVIRRKFAFLPEEAQADVLRRARARRLAAGGEAELSWTGFCSWLQGLSDADLVAIGPGLVAGGAAWSSGQTRANGHTSAPHLEPLTLGRFRNLRRPDVEGFTPAPQPKGGRPASSAVDDLMTDLGLLWFETTGTDNTPAAVRGHKTAFVEMAELALAEAGVKAPETAIKRFFRRIRFHRGRKSSVPWGELGKTKPGAC